MWRRWRTTPARRLLSLKRRHTCQTGLHRRILRRPQPALKSLCRQVGRCDMTFMDEGKTYCLETGKFPHTCIPTNIKTSSLLFNWQTEVYSYFHYILHILSWFVEIMNPVLFVIDKVRDGSSLCHLKPNYCFQEKNCTNISSVIGLLTSPSN